MKTRQELIYDFMLALCENSAVCVGSEDDPKWILEYAGKLADIYLGAI
jgi:hypothetical protein